MENYFKIKLLIICCLATSLDLLPGNIYDKDIQPDWVYKVLDLDPQSFTYYDILGIQKNANNNTIKKSYFKLSKAYHPDKLESLQGQDSKDALEKIKKNNPDMVNVQGKNYYGNVFKLINSAYLILTDENSRKEYEIFLKLSKPKTEIKEFIDKVNATTKNPSFDYQIWNTLQKKAEELHNKYKNIYKDYNMYLLSFQKLALEISLQYGQQKGILDKDDETDTQVLKKLISTLPDITKYTSYYEQGLNDIFYKYNVFGIVRPYFRTTLITKLGELLNQYQKNFEPIKAQATAKKINDYQNMLTGYGIANIPTIAPDQPQKIELSQEVKELLDTINKQAIQGANSTMWGTIAINGVNKMKPLLYTFDKKLYSGYFAYAIYRLAEHFQNNTELRTGTLEELWKFDKQRYENKEIELQELYTKYHVFGTKLEIIRDYLLTQLQLKNETQNIDRYKKLLREYGIGKPTPQELLLEALDIIAKENTISQTQIVKTFGAMLTELKKDEVKNVVEILTAYKKMIDALKDKDTTRRNSFIDTAYLWAKNYSQDPQNLKQTGFDSIFLQILDHAYEKRKKQIERDKKLDNEHLQEFEKLVSENEKFLEITTGRIMRYYYELADLLHTSGDKDGAQKMFVRGLNKSKSIKNYIENTLNQTVESRPKFKKNIETLEKLEDKIYPPFTTKLKALTTSLQNLKTALTSP